MSSLELSKKEQINVLMKKIKLSKYAQDVIRRKYNEEVIHPKKRLSSNSAADIADLKRELNVSEHQIRQFILILRKEDFGKPNQDKTLDLAHACSWVKKHIRKEYKKNVWCNKNKRAKTLGKIYNATAKSVSDWFRSERGRHGLKKQNKKAEKKDPRKSVRRNLPKAARRYVKPDSSDDEDIEEEDKAPNRPARRNPTRDARRPVMPIMLDSSDDEDIESEDELSIMDVDYDEIEDIVMPQDADRLEEDEPMDQEAGENGEEKIEFDVPQNEETYEMSMRNDNRNEDVQEVTSAQEVEKIAEDEPMNQTIKENGTRISKLDVPQNGENYEMAAAKTCWRLAIHGKLSSGNFSERNLNRLKEKIKENNWIEKEITRREVSAEMLQGIGKTASIADYIQELCDLFEKPVLPAQRPVSYLGRFLYTFQL